MFGGFLEKSRYPIYTSQHSMRSTSSHSGRSIPKINSVSRHKTLQFNSHDLHNETQSHLNHHYGGKFSDKFLSFWGLFHHKTLDEIEDEAFERLRVFMFIDKYKANKDYKVVKQIQHLQEEFGDKDPHFVSSFFKKDGRDQSVLNKLFFENRPYDFKDVIAPEKYRDSSSGLAQNSGRFHILQSDKLRIKAPFDTIKYLRSKSLDAHSWAGNSKNNTAEISILKEPLLLDIIDRTPFFGDLESFSHHVNNLQSLTYIRRSHVFYVLSEFYSQMFYRASCLYNVEIMTYYSELFDTFDIQGKILTDSASKDKLLRKLKRLVGIREQLSKGNLNDSVVRALNADSSRYPSSSDLVDKATGLPLDSPLLYADSMRQYGGFWPFSKTKGAKDPEFPAVKMHGVAELTEILFNEPFFEEPKISDPKKTSIEVYLATLFEPVMTTNLSKHKKGDSDRQYMFMEDIKCKMLIAMRETRKFMLLDKFYDAVYGEHTDDFKSIQEDLHKRTKENDKSKRGTNIENKVDELVSQILKRDSDSIDKKVYSNLDLASKNLTGTAQRKFNAAGFTGASDLYLTGLDLIPYIPNYSVSSPAFSSLGSTSLSGVGANVPKFDVSQYMLSNDKRIAPF